jgi:hypothetical protein
MGLAVKCYEGNHQVIHTQSELDMCDCWCHDAATKTTPAPPSVSPTVPAHTERVSPPAVANGSTIWVPILGLVAAIIIFVGAATAYSLYTASQEGAERAALQQTTDTLSPSTKTTTVSTEAQAETAAPPPPRIKENLTSAEACASFWPDNSTYYNDEGWAVCMYGEDTNEFNAWFNAYWDMESRNLPSAEACGSFWPDNGTYYNDEGWAVCMYGEDTNEFNVWFNAYWDMESRTTETP